MGFLEGVEVFDSQPLDSSRIGTLDNPVLVYSLVSFLSSVFSLRSFCLPFFHPLSVLGLVFRFSLWADMLNFFFRTLSALWDAPGLLRIPMTSGGTPFIRISCFVVGNVVPVSPTSIVPPLKSR